MNIFRWFLTGFFAVIFIGAMLWVLNRADNELKQQRAQVAQAPPPYTGPERRSGDRRSDEDRRNPSPSDEPTNTGVLEIPPYVFATPRKDVTIYKMVHEGCEIYFSITLAYSNSTSIALGRGCK